MQTLFAAVFSFELTKSTVGFVSPGHKLVTFPSVAMTWFVFDEVCYQTPQLESQPKMLLAAHEEGFKIIIASYGNCYL